MVMKGWSDLHPGAAKRIPTALSPIMGALIHKLFTVIETNKIITRENKDFSGKNNLCQLSLWISKVLAGSHYFQQVSKNLLQDEIRTRTMRQDKDE